MHAIIEVRQIFAIAIIYIDITWCFKTAVVRMFANGPTTNIPSRKKRAIVQQSIGITDNVAVYQCVHYTIDMYNFMHYQCSLKDIRIVMVKIHALLWC